MLSKIYYTDKYYCLRCKRNVISEIKCDIEKITDNVELIAEILITVNCEECGGYIKYKYLKIEI